MSLSQQKILFRASLVMILFCGTVWVIHLRHGGIDKGDIDNRDTDNVDIDDRDIYNGSRVPSSLIELPDKNSLPFRDYIKNGNELKEVKWIPVLHSYLTTLDKKKSPHVHMVFGDSLHSQVVLNWLVGALVHLKPPLPHALVLSLDQNLCDIIHTKNYTCPVTCIAAPVETILAFDGKDWITGTMVRPLTLRLINFWGYDVATYDSDAVLLKNPQVLYDKLPHIKLMASPSMWPKSIASKWGFSLCTGALYFKASSSMETLWRGVSDAVGIDRDRDEQVVLNVGLININVTWKRTTSLSKACSIEDGWEGQANHNLTVFVFSEQLMCRADCCSNIKIEDIYIVHPYGTHVHMDQKVKVLRRMKAWFLD